MPRKSERRPPWKERPFRLVSWYDMNKFSAAAFFEMSKILTSMSVESARFDTTLGKTKDMVEKWFSDMSDKASEIGLKQSAKLARRVAESVTENTKPKEVGQNAAELRARIQDEMEDGMFLSVSSDLAGFYDASLQRWPRTVAGYPSAVFDIEEASRCLALRRNTACVFHLMRVMGAGVTALGKSLHEPALDASHKLTWDNVLSRCSKELSDKFASRSEEWRSDKEFYAEATATLLAVKDAWRNPNAHEVGQKYTDEEVDRIYRAVLAFMERISARLKELPN